MHWKTLVQRVSESETMPIQNHAAEAHASMALDTDTSSAQVHTQTLSSQFPVHLNNKDWEIAIDSRASSTWFDMGLISLMLVSITCCDHMSYLKHRQRKPPCQAPARSHPHMLLQEAAFRQWQVLLAMPDEQAASSL